MSYLVANHKERFSHDEAHLFAAFSTFFCSSWYKSIRIFNGCEVRIENSVTRNHEACRDHYGFLYFCTKRKSSMYEMLQIHIHFLSLLIFKYLSLMLNIL